MWTITYIRRWNEIDFEIKRCTVQNERQPRNCIASMRNTQEWPIDICRVGAVSSVTANAGAHNPACPAHCRL